MFDVLDALLLVLSAVLVAYLVLVTVITVLRPVRRATAGLRNLFVAPFSASFGAFDQDTRFAQLDDEVRQTLGMDELADDRERADVIQAAIAAQQITILDHKLRKAAGQCLRTHWAVA